jgi:hypothetical protein
MEELVGRQPTEVGVNRAEERGQGPLETREENLRSESNGEEEVSETAKEETAEVEEEGGTQVVTRSGRQVTRPSRYAMVTKVAHSAWQEEAAKEAIKKELAQLIDELVAIVPVKRNKHPRRRDDSKVTYVFNKQIPCIKTQRCSRTNHHPRWPFSQYSLYWGWHVRNVGGLSRKLTLKGRLFKLQ